MDSGVHSRTGSVHYPARLPKILNDHDAPFVFHKCVVSTVEPHVRTVDESPHVAPRRFLCAKFSVYSEQRTGWV